MRGPDEFVRTLLFRASLILLLPLLIPACTESDPEPEPQSPDPVDAPFTHPGFEPGRRLDTIFAVDIDDDDRPEQIVTSIAESSSYFPPNARADLLEIWDRTDTGDTWSIVYTDTLSWITDLRLAELTGDRRPELVLQTTGGGNDPIAADGMAIVTGAEGKIRTLWRRSSGMPRIERLGNRRVVVIHELFWPPYLPHASAVRIPTEVLGFAGGSIRADFEDARQFYTERASGLREDLERRSVSSGEAGPADADEFYRLSVELILALRAAGSSDEITSFARTTLPRLSTVIDDDRRMILLDLVAGQDPRNRSVDREEEQEEVVEPTEPEPQSVEDDSIRSNERGEE